MRRMGFEIAAIVRTLAHIKMKKRWRRRCYVKGIRYANAVLSQRNGIAKMLQIV